MSFRELRDKLIEADNQAVDEWRARENELTFGPPSISAQLSFVEYRRSMLAGAIGEILNELIAREEVKP